MDPDSARAQILTREQIFKTQLSVIGLQMVRTGNAGHVQRFADCIEMKPYDPRGKSNRRNPAPVGQSADGRFAHLKDFSELLRGQKFFAIGHTFAN